MSAREPRVGLKGGRRKRHSLAEKLAARTTKQPSGCWEVEGHPLHSGHLHISEGSVAAGTFRRVRAHVLAWELAHGRRVPAGMVVLHRCDNPRCVNPDHLLIGTQRANIYDSIRKGRYNVFGRQKLNAEQVQDIRRLVTDGVLHRVIASQFGIARNTVSGIARGASWRHLDEFPFATTPAATWHLSRFFERVPSIELPVKGTVA